MKFVPNPSIQNNMNLLYIATGDKWLKNETACIYFCPKQGQFFTYTQILSE